MPNVIPTGSTPMAADSPAYWTNHPFDAEPLSRLSVIIPARDEEQCIASTVEHLHRELSIHGVPHEIISVDDGSADATWQVLAALAEKIDTFKAYRREVIEGCKPILSPHFNITVELPLKAIVRGYSWTVMRITGRNRRSGVAKLKIREMGSRYFFIVAYVWLEKYFSRGDYRRVPTPHPRS